MSVITAVVTKEADGVVLISWPNMANGDTGSLVKCANLPDKSVQLTGTLGASGQCDIEGTNDGSTYATLHDVGGTLLNITSLGIDSVLENTIGIRPSVSVGDGTTDLTVTMVVKV